MTGPNITLAGDLAKPAATLIEKVSDAVGGIARPWQIKRVAKAEAQANIILAEAQIAVATLERRAIERLVQEEARKQANIELITAKATQYLTDDSKPEQLDPDWIVHFFERSRLTSNEDMQHLWARVLAGAANHPASFSRRTVDLISVIEQSDAELFCDLSVAVCSFRQYKGKNCNGAGFTDHTPVIFSVYPDDMSQWTFDQLTHLADLGFINFIPEGGYSITDIPERAEFTYNGRKYSIHSGEELAVGTVIFTRAGKEIFSILEPRHDEGYFEDNILNRWISRNNQICCVID